MHPEINQKLPQLKAALKKHKIVRAFLFGSAISEQFNKDSDIDLLVAMQSDIDPVEAGEHFWDLYYDLKKLFNREVDILSERSLKNPYLIQELDQKKLLVYEA